MEEDRATEVVEQLRARRVFAHVERAGVYKFGVRVVIPDGREAVWDADGAAGLEATVLRDGVLVGFVPRIPGSERFDVSQTVEAIAAADYDTASPERASGPDTPAGTGSESPASPPAASPDPASPPAPAATRPASRAAESRPPGSSPIDPPRRGLLRRFLGR